MTKRPFLTHDLKVLGLAYIGMIPLCLLLFVGMMTSAVPWVAMVVAGAGYCLLFTLTLKPERDEVRRELEDADLTVRFLLDHFDGWGDDSTFMLPDGTLYERTPKLTEDELFERQEAAEDRAAVAKAQRAFTMAMYKHNCVPTYEHGRELERSIQSLYSAIRRMEGDRGE